MSNTNSDVFELRFLLSMCDKNRQCSFMVNERCTTTISPTVCILVESSEKSKQNAKQTKVKIILIFKCILLVLHMVFYVFILKYSLLTS